MPKQKVNLYLRTPVAYPQTRGHPSAITVEI